MRSADSRVCEHPPHTIFLIHEIFRARACSRVSNVHKALEQAFVVRARSPL
jgi:hypothetical protein